MEPWKWLNMGLEVVSRFVLQKALVDGQRGNTDKIVANQAAMEEKRQQIQLAQYKLQCVQVANNAVIEEKRQEIQLEQIKLQYIQNQENRQFQAEQGELNHQRQKELQEYIQSVNLAIHKSNIEFQRWRFEQEKTLQKELTTYGRETQLMVAEYQRETAIKVAHDQAEVQKIFANWPLTLPPAQILESYNNSLIPMRVFIAPPKVQFEKFATTPQNFPDIELTINQKMRDFFDQYSQQGRPIEFLAGAWESKRFHSEASIKALFGMLKSEPTLILESEFDGDYINFRVAYWTIGQPNYSYQTIISQLSYRDILYDSAKTRARKWKVTKDKLLALGKTQADIDKRGGDNEINLKIWEEEQSLREEGIDDDELEIHYKINSKHFEDLYQFLITCHCLVAGWIADTHHLFLHDFTPLSPQLLPDLTQNIPEGEVADSVIGMVISGYEQIYKILETESSHRLPELILELAQGLVNLPNKSWAKNQLINSVESWLNLRNPVSEVSELWDRVNSVVIAEDLDYIEKINNLLESLGETHRVNIVKICYQRGKNHCQQGEYTTAIDDFTQVLLLEPNSPDANYNRGLAYSKLGEYSAAIEDYNQTLRLNPNYLRAYNNRANTYYKLGEYEKAIADYNSCLVLNPNLPDVAHNRDVAQGVWDEKRRQEAEKRRREREFEFDVITVNAQGKETHRERRRAEFFKEDLGNNISLEMVSIPGGTFMMGAAQNEASASSDEYPQHPVNIAAFSMAKYPITQAQWEAIMGNNPSNFKGTNRPVDSVNWHEAREFCQRLSQKTGKTYRLPSEAEWEYACRAQTTSPFHFGETITADLANYGGNCGQTTDVGSFNKPNAFGLYDMHGNVWEWCADPWHENYTGAPDNGSVWESGGNTQLRCLRGGSWIVNPDGCRSAHRDRDSPGDFGSGSGFRVCWVVGASLVSVQDF
ncbi:SUMF1/EgtB/PvdO family nonheme iron enzyme [Planktothrix agardhii 1032]|uniref:SUMF1/EgtB/PvdO family nonheme iron enzyme n=1 Tax=Planktothrix agardhii TaxID=1160 RepID=UPI001D0A510C|nr:SUMF1/EgtB/PvdO family nonheme iron enzyme [Planktothrix agardhii]MCB8777088.1 SUMF1/EgtB/PvdO family nonheme iron enzyme [Planktothrix agardhii 1031]MCF3599405.1 SUMF1/EgtB/PvdO family nonheme iron enzyme [Planktothrix agardhii 1032]